MTTGVAGLLLAMPGPIVADNPDREVVSKMPNRLAPTIAALESDASEEAVQNLTDLLRRGVNAADEYSFERRKSRDAGAKSENYELRKASVEEIVAEINSHPPMDVDWLWLVTLYGWSSPEEVAQGWAIDFPEPLQDLSESEVLILLDGVDRHSATPKLDRFLWFLDLSLGEAFNTDLIFYPYREWDNDGLAKEIISRRGIIETGGQDALDAYELEVAQEVWANLESKHWALQWASSRLYPEDRSIRYEKLQERDRLAEEHSSAKQPD